MTWYNHNEFDIETLKLLEVLTCLDYTDATKNHFKKMNIVIFDCWQHTRNKRVRFSTICKSYSVELLQIDCDTHKNLPLITVFSSLSMSDLLNLITRLKEEFDKFYRETNQRILAERINEEAFETKARTNFLSKFLNR